jgi:RNA recognition motif-containing protein
MKCAPFHFRPNSINNFKANWATGGATSIPGTSLHASPAPGDKEYSVFIGDLSPQATEEDLVKVFLNPPPGIEPFSSTVGAKIMRDPVSGVSKLFGFVR